MKTDTIPKKITQKKYGEQTINGKTNTIYIYIHIYIQYTYIYTYICLFVLAARKLKSHT